MQESFARELSRREYREPIGMRTIGSVDPRQLTQAEFLRSPECVYHGARSGFELDQYFDFSDAKNYRDTFLGEGGLTIGAGLYATPDRVAAEDYVQVRGTHRGRLYTLLPYKARMLDLRDKRDPRFNGEVPRELVEEWAEVVRAKCRIEHEKAKQKSELTFGEELMLEWWDEYMNRLDCIVKTGNTYSLRSILATGDDEDARQELPRMHFTAPAPPWVVLWTKFMLYKGIDGVLYHEGGESDNIESSLNAVFYNMEKVGTYASWHRERGHGVR